MLLPEVTLLAQCVCKSLLLLALLLLTSQGVSLGLDSFLSPLTGCLGLCTFGIHFFLEDPLTVLLRLSLVNVVNQSTLVLEGVTLAQLVELVVEVLVDLAGGTVLDKKASENT